MHNEWYKLILSHEIIYANSFMSSTQIILVQVTYSPLPQTDAIVFGTSILLFTLKHVRLKDRLGKYT